jgi:glutamyl-tRNA reductase
MTLVALGLSHRTTPLEELERAAIPAAALSEALPCLVRAPDVREAIILSTCNRTEVYAWAKDIGAATDQVRMFLEDLRGLPAGWIKRRARVMTGDEVIRHLFAVTAGLDSMIVGESEIQGQVRAAYRTAATLGAVGPHLHGLFRWALEAGKRSRTDTGLRRNRESLPRAAVRALDATLDGIEGREVVVVGNGAMAEASVRALRLAGARSCVTARRIEAAEALAERYDAVALPLHALRDALAAADAAVFATSTPEPLVGCEELELVLAQRAGRPLVIVDLGLPRNVDPAAAGLSDAGLELLDLARLDDDRYTVVARHAEQLEAASAITVAEAERCVAWFRTRPADAVVAAIQAEAARIAEEEIAEAERRIAGLNDRERTAIEQAIRRSVRKVVHLPTVRAKEACARGDDALLEAARWLFGLESAQGSVAPRPHAKEAHR